MFVYLRDLGEIEDSGSPHGSLVAQPFMFYNTLGNIHSHRFQYHGWAVETNSTTKGRLSYHKQSVMF